MYRICHGSSYYVQHLPGFRIPRNRFESLFCRPFARSAVRFGGRVRSAIPVCEFPKGETTPWWVLSKTRLRLLSLESLKPNLENLKLVSRNVEGLVSCCRSNLAQPPQLRAFQFTHRPACVAYGLLWDAVAYCFGLLRLFRYKEYEKNKNMYTYLSPHIIPIVFLLSSGEDGTAHFILLAMPFCAQAIRRGVQIQEASPHPFLPGDIFEILLSFWDPCGRFNWGSFLWVFSE